MNKLSLSRARARMLFRPVRYFHCKIRRKIKITRNSREPFVCCNSRVIYRCIRFICSRMVYKYRLAVRARAHYVTKLLYKPLCLEHKQKGASLFLFSLTLLLFPFHLYLESRRTIKRLECTKDYPYYTSLLPYSRFPRERFRNRTTRGCRCSYLRTTKPQYSSRRYVCFAPRFARICVRVLCIDGALRPWCLSVRNIGERARARQAKKNRHWAARARSLARTFRK